MKVTNQYTAPDPRQAVFSKNYFDPKSKTFSNALQAGLKAGYSYEYAKTILSQDVEWLSEIIRDNDLIKKAEKNLVTFLCGEDEKIKADITKFVLERLHKKKYGKNLDLTSKGESISLSEEEKNKINQLLDDNKRDNAKERK